MFGNVFFFFFFFFQRYKAPQNFTTMAAHYETPYNTEVECL